MAKRGQSAFDPVIVAADATDHNHSHKMIQQVRPAVVDPVDFLDPPPSKERVPLLTAKQNRLFSKTLCTIVTLTSRSPL